MVYLKSVENVITLGKLIGLLFLFCLPLSILFLRTKRNDLAHPVMGTIFLVRHTTDIRYTDNIIGRAKRAPHWCSLEILYIVGMSDVVCRSMSVICQINCVGGIMWPTRMLKVFLGRLNQ